MQSQGTIFFKDDYDVVYHTTWETIGGVLDVTSTVGSPIVWGEQASGYQLNGILYRRGIITITRQVLRPLANGYEIVAEGVSQFIDFIQMNYPCQPGPQDNFKYHLNNPLVDQTEIVVTDGPHWADPDVSTDADMVWGDLDSGGSPVPISGTVLEFIDVWG